MAIDMALKSLASWVDGQESADGELVDMYLDVLSTGERATERAYLEEFANRWADMPLELRERRLWDAERVAAEIGIALVLLTQFTLSDSFWAGEEIRHSRVDSLAAAVGWESSWLLGLVSYVW